jgi:digeranylgeranylglycerophospholipid reductase
MGLQIPSDAVAEEIKGVKVIFPDGTHTMLREKGYDLNKDVFEQYLAVRAQGEGANLKTGVRVLGMQRTNHVWTLNSRTMAIKSQALIDASGYQSVSNEMLRINQKKFDIASGAQYLMDNVESDGYIQFYIWPNLAPRGYLWIMPKGEGRANVGIVSNDAKNLHKNLKQFIKERELYKSKIIRPFGGVIPSSGPMHRTYWEGLLFAGDAAGFTSPMFEGGTQLALKSGELAAQTIAECSKEKLQEGEDKYSAQKLSAYEKKWKKEFPPYKKLLKGREYFHSFSEAEFNKIAKILPEDLTNLGTSDKLKIGTRLMMQAPGLIFKNFIPAMDAFSYSTGEHYGW